MAWECVVMGMATWRQFDALGGSACGALADGLALLTGEPATGRTLLPVLAQTDRLAADTALSSGYWLVASGALLLLVLIGIWSAVERRFGGTHG